MKNQLQKKTWKQANVMMKMNVPALLELFLLIVHQIWKIPEKTSSKNHGEDHTKQLGGDVVCINGADNKGYVNTRMKL